MERVHFIDSVVCNKPFVGVLFFLEFGSFLLRGSAGAFFVLLVVLGKLLALLLLGR